MIISTSEEHLRRKLKKIIELAGNSNADTLVDEAMAILLGRKTK